MNLLRFMKHKYQKASVFDASDANLVRKLRVFVAFDVKPVRELSVVVTFSLLTPPPPTVSFSGPLGGKKQGVESN